MEDAPGAELERFRALVGPSEIAYSDLLRDRDESQRIARDALAELGELRGQIEEMSVQLSRARQDQDVLLQRAAMTGFGQIADRAKHRWRTSVTPRLSKLLPRRVS